MVTNYGSVKFNRRAPGSVPSYQGFNSSSNRSFPSLWRPINVQKLPTSNVISPACQELVDSGNEHLMMADWKKRLWRLMDLEAPWSNVSPLKERLSCSFFINKPRTLKKFPFPINHLLQDTYHSKHQTWNVFFFIFKRWKNGRRRLG